MKKILFVSSILSNKVKDELLKYARNDSPFSEAANTFQQSIIDGLSKNNMLFDVISAPSLPACPMGYNRLSIPSIKEILDERVTLEIIPYSTFFLWKYYSIELILTRKILEWVEKNSTYNLSILIYNVDPAFMAAVKKIKKKYPMIKTAIIVTDMIEDVNNFKSNQNLMKKIQLGLHRYKIFNSYDAIDKYILLSELMKERIPNCNDNYIVVEGIYTTSESYYKDISEKQNIIFYSGTLDSYVNVPEMIEAYKNIEEANYKLVICGGGPLSAYVKQESENNNNIVYLGSISRSEVLKWQKKAALLINPRKPSEITKYSFPSKTMEYFASGTPVLMYRLQGIPDEYYNYCYTICGTTVEEFTESLKDTLDRIEDDDLTLGLKAKCFIFNNKTSKLQVRRIIDFIYE